MLPDVGTSVRDLSNFNGTLQADGYAGSDQIYEAGRIQETEKVLRSRGWVQISRCS